MAGLSRRGEPVPLGRVAPELRARPRSGILLAIGQFDGFDRVVGTVGDITRLLAEHPELAEASLRLSANDFAGWHVAAAMGAEPVQLIDVRNPGETEGGVLPGALRIPLAALVGRIDELDPAATTVAYCAGGYRSIMAASLLTARGFRKVADMLGGYDAWKAAGLPTAEPERSEELRRR